MISENKTKKELSVKYSEEFWERESSEVIGEEYDKRYMQFHGIKCLEFLEHRISNIVEIKKKIGFNCVYVTSSCENRPSKSDYIIPQKWKFEDSYKDYQNYDAKDESMARDRFSKDYEICEAEKQYIDITKRIYFTIYFDK